jgi:hypothetical protein
LCSHPTPNILKKKTKNMKRVLLLSTIAALYGSAVLAQDAANQTSSHWSVGAHAGSTLSRLFLGKMEINKKYNLQFSSMIGINTAFAFSDEFSIAAELNYISLQSGRQGFQPLMPSSPIQTTSYQRYANFKKTESFDLVKFYANIGPYICLAIQAKMRTSGQSLMYLDNAGLYHEPLNGSYHSLDQSKDISGDITTLNFGFATGAGIGYTWNNNNVWLDSRYNSGLMNIRTNTAVNGENYIAYFSLCIGYSYNLPR